MTADFHAMLEAAKLPERTVDVCLAGDLVAQHEQLDRELAQASKSADANSLEGDPRIPDLAARIEALQDEMRAATYVFRLRALPPRRYRKLVAEHPPRRNDDGELDQGDYNLGFNRDTLLHELLPLTVYDPQLTEAEWRDLLGDSETEAARLEAEGLEVAEGRIAYSQFMDLVNTAYVLNEGKISVPFSLAASLTKRTTGDG